MDVKQKEKELEKIAQQVNDCQSCQLCRQANRGVPGEGNADAGVVFIGEGPGYHEDQRGIPFCGAAGRLLDRALQSIKLGRNDVWIGNVVKHRPPGNRDPLPEEIEACRPFLERQLEIIAPEVVVTLGRFSMSMFMPGEFISRIHGQARYANYGGRKLLVLPMYHPAAALRNGQVMKSFLEDFKKISLYLGKDNLETDPEIKENKVN